MKSQLRFEKLKVKDLRKHLDDGRFAVPKLQRAFVWNGNRAAKLLDSIYRGMPIGALTLWDTSRANKHLLRVTTKVLPPHSDRHPRVWFILDGQQRLSVIYRTLIGGAVMNGSHVEVDFGRLSFRVTEGDAETRFQYRKADFRIWFPLADVLKPAWKPQAFNLTPGQGNRAIAFRKILREYVVPIVRVETDDLKEARELFIRINSAGTPIGAADRAFARASKFDIRVLAEQVWERLPVVFQGLTDEVLLQTRGLLDGIDDVGVDAMNKVVDLWDGEMDRDAEIASRRFAKLWSAQEKAIHRALDLLKKEFCVLDDGLLPSRYMVATLAVFFEAYPKQPSAVQLAEIRKWFWSTALGQRYSGRGYRQNILQDATYFRALARTGARKFVIDEPVDPAVLQQASYLGRSSVADAFMCLLISKKPLYLSNGTAMQVADFASAANRKHKHHIFPRKFLRDHKVGKLRLNSAMNLCLIPAEENSEFGSKAPAKYLAKFEEARHFGRCMERHLIPCDESSGLWQSDAKGYALFLRQRERLVRAAFEVAAGCRLFRREPA